MHEIAIVQDILQTLQSEYAEKFDKIIKVQVEAGLLCNVQPILIQNAYEALLEANPQLAEIDLEVVLLPIIAWCSECQAPFEVRYHKFVCSCGKVSRLLLQGEELRISKVEYLTD